jgi:hypothetical protein
MQMNSEKKLILLPVKVPWAAYRYGIGIKAFEESELVVSTIVSFSDRSDVEITIRFSSFAEVKFKNLNFEEHNYAEYLIASLAGETIQDGTGHDNNKLREFWLEHGICPDPGFYIVENSTWFEEKQAFSDLKSNGFKHFLITGYESYVEILARDNFAWKELI